jgi:hypothetical protein
MSGTPSVPTAKLDEWGFEEHERTTRTRLSLPQVEIREHTVVYGDARLRSSVRDSSGVDRTWRFFFATGLEFLPPLPPGVGPVAVYPMVQSEGRRGFETDLRERSIEDVERAGTERVRVDTGERATLTRYRGRHTVDGESYGVEGWFGIWTRQGRFRLAGGGFPTKLPGTAAEPDRYRSELLTLVRGVE